jgi:hypothetical protein
MALAHDPAYIQRDMQGDLSREDAQHLGLQGAKNWPGARHAPRCIYMAYQGDLSQSFHIAIMRKKLHSISVQKLWIERCTPYRKRPTAKCAKSCAALRNFLRTFSVFLP